MFEGTKSVWPFYFLKPERVADRTIAAIRQEEPLVVMPYRGNIVFLLKCFPIGLQTWIGNLLGVSNAMNDFKGRGDISQRLPGI